MKALYFDKKLEIRDLPTPIPDPGEALVKVKTAGICSTDREIIAGYMNFTGVPGHEFVGEIVEAQDKSIVGKRVVGEINAGCGDCEWCRKGMGRHCPQRTVLGILGRNGAFAEYLVLPLENLFEVPDNVSDHSAVFTEPLAAAMEIAEQVKLTSSWRALIVGDGKLSALIAQTLKLYGLDITIAGKSREKLGLFKQWGISITMSEPPPMSFDLVVEASGHPSGWNTAVSSVKPRGILALKSTYTGGLNFNPAPLVINEITVVGSRCGRFPPALRLLADGLIEVDNLISRVFPFSEIIDAIEYAQKPECFKVLIEFE